MPTTKDHALLILDVDETLIHATDPTENPPDPDPPRIDFISAGTFRVMKRPHVDWFLRSCFASPHFKVAAWSKAGPEHVHSVFDHLLQPSEKLEFVFTGKRCTQHLVFPDEWGENDERVIYLKDLKKVRALGYDLNRVLALDDTYRIWKRSYGNIVHIRPFTGDDQDDELLRVFPLLEQWFQDPRGVRKIEKRFWNRSTP